MVLITGQPQRSEDLPLVKVSSQAAKAEWFVPANVEHELPRSLKMKIARIHLAWGEAETALLALISRYRMIHTGNAEVPKKPEKKYLIRVFLRYLDFQASPDVVQVWSTIKGHRKIIQHIRNTFAHRHIVGVLKTPPNHIFVNGVNPNGSTFCEAIPTNQVDMALALLEAEVIVLRAHYSDLWEFLEAEKASAKATPAPLPL